MTVETVMYECICHKHCKDCPYHDEEVNACIFAGTPDTWDPYGRKSDHLVDKAYPDEYPEDLLDRREK